MKAIMIQLCFQKKNNFAKLGIITAQSMENKKPYQSVKMKLIFIGCNVYRGVLNKTLNNDDRDLSPANPRRSAGLIPNCKHILFGRKSL